MAKRRWRGWVGVRKRKGYSFIVSLCHGSAARLQQAPDCLGTRAVFVEGPIAAWTLLSVLPHSDLEQRKWSEAFELSSELSVAFFLFSCPGDWQSWKWSGEWRSHLLRLPVSKQIVNHTKNSFKILEHFEMKMKKSLFFFFSFASVRMSLSKNISSAYIHFL